MGTNPEWESMKDTLFEVAKATPPVAVSGMVFMGVSLSDWALLLTITYTILLLFFLIRDKIWHPWLERRRKLEE